MPAADQLRLYESCRELRLRVEAALEAALVEAERHVDRQDREIRVRRAEVARLKGRPTLTVIEGGRDG